MNETEKRIKVVKLLQALRHSDEKPGDIILRALRLALKRRLKHERDQSPLG